MRQYADKVLNVAFMQFTVDSAFDISIIRSSRANSGLVTLIFKHKRADGNFKAFVCTD